MLNVHKRKWLVEIYLLLIPTVNLQIPIPIYGIPQPQIYALPPPPPIAIPYPVPVLYKEKETTTRKPTTKADVFVAVPVPVPAPYPVPMPVYPQPPPIFPLQPFPQKPPTQNFCFKDSRPKDCPQCRPCPPHPVPAPVFPFAGYPVIRPPSYVMLPFPKKLPRPKYLCSVEHSSREYETSSSTGDSDDDDVDSSGSSSSSAESSVYHVGKKFGHVLKRPKSRRNLQFPSDDGKSVQAKPILSYINKNGDVKIKQRITNDEALQLMNKNKRTFARPEQIESRQNTDYEERVPQEIKVVAERDSVNSHIKITSNIEMNKLASGQQSPVVVKSRSGQPVLSEGRKELIFRHPNEKRISNLSLSFHIN